MAVCIPSVLANFVSDCADIACATELTANYFLSALVPPTSMSLPQVTFTEDLLGPDQRCGSVDLSSWLAAASTALASAASAPYAPEYAVGSAATSFSSSSATTTAAPKPTSTHVWRPIVLAVVCTVLLTFLATDSLLLVFVQRRRAALRAVCEESDHCPT
ncbi:hypothetical protein ABB37_00500 [Leptomonas pyrrhocoris]|uniref:Uncharacterized protein n=1 Tax=Leptomonas pyrrhocoris TaxID=157538 RepID=A0A0N0E0C2_LEPPY|nr:hypothetical protein ABB37_00500 [Leptomonas pyrrhocoris]KPA86272.1 hypothetical protein ABB37_00500 [Leptomonas pyrrhocoris]|eukprot:XP_015664711.1 hypothetical protein ABB37_00500 [Leptomonas pyrrhocoris]